MYAIVEIGTKQYFVRKGDKIKVEKLQDEPGKELEIKPLVIKTENGLKQDGSVKLKVLKTAKGKKVLVFKHKPKKNYKRLNGHRQYYTELEVLDIV